MVLRERVAGQVVAGRLAPDVEPPSEVTKFWASSLGESLLREFLLGKSLGDSLEELLPVSDLLRPSLVPTARESREIDSLANVSTH
jgi:hypothetical protein